MPKAKAEQADHGFGAEARERKPFLTHTILPFFELTKLPVSSLEGDFGRFPPLLKPHRPIPCCGLPELRPEAM